ncbi:hypothetical protein VKT23_017922 [Stygiomarasmius scandens]|uniref:HNH nuclease domain-containing protein n=1 Tax=Marasmiellus scandens TaxID=2682957 RepID=A0ABR1ISP8_9AGAR
MSSIPTSHFDIAGVHNQLASRPSSSKKRKVELSDSNLVSVQPVVANRLPVKQKKKRSLASYVKRNVNKEVVKALAPAETSKVECICVISRARPSRTVIEYSHVMDLETSSHEMDCLEWAWGMEYRTLNLDTRMNIQTIRAPMHHWYNMTEASKPVGWFWLPDDLGVILDMHRTYVGQGDIEPVAGRITDVRKDPYTFYTVIPGSRFRYRLIPLLGMARSWSVKQYAGDPSGPFDPDFLRYYEYPFDTLPECYLHIPYHFVIVNTGKKLFQLYGKQQIDYARDFSFLSNREQYTLNAVRNIYVAWINAQHPSQSLRGEDDPSKMPFVQACALQGQSVEPSGGADQASGADTGLSDAAPKTCKGQRPASVDSLTPWDSVSNVGPEDAEDPDIDDKPFVDDEDEEEEDEEWLEGLKQWVRDVRAAMNDDTGNRSTLETIAMDVEVVDAPPKIDEAPVSPMQLDPDR